MDNFEKYQEKETSLREGLKAVVSHANIEEALDLIEGSIKKFSSSEDGQAFAQESQKKCIARQTELNRLGELAKELDDKERKGAIDMLHVFYARAHDVFSNHLSGRRNMSDKDAQTVLHHLENILELAQDLINAKK